MEFALTTLSGIIAGVMVLLIGLLFNSKGSTKRFRETIRKIDCALSKNAGILTSPGIGEIERQNQVSSELSHLSSELSSLKNAIRNYRLQTILRRLPKPKNVARAKKGLTYLSNTVMKERECQGLMNLTRMIEIRKTLGLEVPEGEDLTDEQIRDIHNEFFGK